MKKLLVFAILTLGVATVPAVTAGAADPAADEAAFVNQINALRSIKGLPALEVHPNLVDKARSWAGTMSAAGRIWHSTLSEGITANWLKLGENVGMGGDVGSLHAAFIASPKHYDNLVDPAFGYFGIGVVYAGNTIFVSEMFMKLDAKPAPVPVVVPVAVTTPTPEATPAPAPAPAPAARPRVAAKPKAVPAPAPAPVAAPPAPEPATAPAPEPLKPSPLLVSVLERLRDFN